MKINLTEKTKKKFDLEYRRIHSYRQKAHMIGEQVMFHAWEIQNLTMEHPGSRMMDFGCGKAYPYTQRNLGKLFFVDDILLYDIGIERYSRKPKQSEFTSVISCDVLEHIPEELIDETFSYWYHNKMEFVFATIAAYPANATLSDGTNAHVNQNNWEWWHKKIKQHITCHSKFIYMPGRHASCWQTYEYKK